LERKQTGSVVLHDGKKKKGSRGIMSQPVTVFNLMTAVFIFIFIFIFILLKKKKRKQHCTLRTNVLASSQAARPLL
jgi:hypothetical protein